MANNATYAWGVWLAAGLFLGCQKKTPAPAPVDPNYYARMKFVLQENPNYAPFVQQLGQDGLLDSLALPGPYTVILSKSQVNLPPDNTTQDQLLRYQVMDKAVSLRALPLRTGQVIPWEGGMNIFVSRYLFGGDTITTLNGVTVVQADVPTANGLIQVVDNDTATNNAPYPAVYHTVYDELQARQDTRLLAIILGRVHLDTLLDGKGPFTVLAPTNDAMGGMGINTVDDAYAADSLTLVRFVKNLILPGRFFLSDFLYGGLGSYTMLGGEALTVSVSPVTYAPDAWSYNFSGPGNASPVNISTAYTYSDPNGSPTDNGVVITTSQAILP